MTKHNILFDDGIHKCIAFHFDGESMEDSFLAVNQHLIIHDGYGILLDPGSRDIYDELYDAVSNYMDIENLQYIFFSHQDPDVADSITQWSISTPAKLLISSIWTRFMGHYGLMDMGKLSVIEDKGKKIELASQDLEIIPAHFLHSPGNFSLYDSYSKILFSGDIGANISSDFYNQPNNIDDFKAIKPLLESFHKRYMAGNKFCKAWVQKVRKFDIELIAPQHGSAFSKGASKDFLNWFEELECGGDLLEAFYEGQV